MAKKRRTPKRAAKRIVKQRVIHPTEYPWKPKRTSLLIDAAMVFLGIAIIAGLLIGKRMQNKQPLTEPTVVPLITEIPLTPQKSPAATTPQKATPTTQPTKTPTLTPTKTATQAGQMQPKVKKLPFTKSDTFTYTLKQGDSLAKIGQRFCADPRAYLYIEEDNNLVEPYTLHPGDTILVSCR